MDDKTLELISAYADGQATAPQVQQVESLLRQDPEARQVYEEMKAFGATIAATGPAEAGVPADFRDQVMERICLEAAAPTKPESGGGMGKLISSPYAISGLVLTALLGTMAFLDLAKSGRTPDAPHSQTEAPSSRERELPRLREVAGTQAEIALEADLSREQAYVRGRGGVRVKNRGRAGETASPDLAVVSKLDQSAAWSQEEIQRFLPSADAVRLLAQARQNRINPGLLVAAVRYAGVVDFSAAGPRIRASLDQSMNQPEMERLSRVIRELGGDEQQAASWSRLIRKEIGN